MVLPLSVQNNSGSREKIPCTIFCGAAPLSSEITVAVEKRLKPAVYKVCYSVVLFSTVEKRLKPAVIVLLFLN